MKNWQEKVAIGTVLLVLLIGAGLACSGLASSVTAKAMKSDPKEEYYINPAVFLQELEKIRETEAEIKQMQEVILQQLQEILIKQQDEQIILELPEELYL